MRFSLDLSHQEEVEDEEVQAAAAAAAAPSISGEEGFVDDVEATATSNSRITPGATPSPSSFPLGAHTNHQRRKKKKKKQRQQPPQDEEDDDDNDSKASSSSSRSRGPKGVTSVTVASVILILGCAATGAFWTIGVLQAIGDSQKAFEYDVERLAHRMHSAFREYESAGLWVQQSCSSHHYEHSSGNDGSNSSSSSPYAPNFRSYFRELYEAVVAQDLPLYAIEYVPNVTHEERSWYEQEAKQFYQSFYPGLAVHYNGFSGVTQQDDDHHNHGNDEHNHNMPTETTFELAPLPDNVADFYYPIHFVEPIEGNEEVIDIDIYNFMPSSQRIIDMALDTMQSHITGRMRLLQEPDPSPDAYSVLLIHPGRPSTNPYDQTGTYNFRGDVSIITIRIPELLEFMAEQDHLYESLQSRLPNMQVYLFDSTPNDSSETDHDQPVFLGAAELHKHQTTSAHGEEDGDDAHSHMFHHSNEYYEPLPEVSYEELTGRTDVRIHIESILVGQRNWTIACIAGDESYPSGATLSILAGAMILIAFICLAMWIHALMNRAALESRLKSKAQEEQSLLRIDHARQAAAAERQLNEFIAHEVRNPLAAAMSACSFVTSALQQESEVEEAAVKAKARQKALKNNNNNRPSTARQVVPLPNSNSNSNNTPTAKKETLAVTAPLFQIPPPLTSPSPQQKQRTSAINQMTNPPNNGPNNNPSPLFKIPVAPSSPTISASASGNKPAPLFSITPSSPSTAGRASVAPPNNTSSANTAAQATALSGNGSKPTPLFSINPTSNTNGQNTAPNENGNNKPAPLFSMAPSNNTAQNATPTTIPKEQGNKPAPLFSIAPSSPNSSSNVQNNPTSDGSERPAPLFSIMAPPPASSPAANQEQGNKPAPLFSIMPNKNPAAASTCTNQQTSTTTDGPRSIPAPLFSLAPSTTTITPKKKEEHNNSNSVPAPLFSLMSAPEAPLDASMSSLPAMPMVSNLETREAILADCHIIDSSLQFINDLLRNMLDVQRAACHQLNIEKGPTDVLHDILEPVEAMLYMRGRSVEVQLDYDENDMNFLVETDRLRLKQVVLNLGRNAAKFVEKGYVRFCVKVVPATVPYPQQEVKKGKRRSILKSANSSNGDCIEQALGGQETVQIWIEDTGPGIPESKKQNLFGKFQESLDTLSQGTGLGLSLVKIICRLMGGEVWLDESYHSGFDDRPGARFIIDLHTPPMRVEDSTHNNAVAVEGDIEAQAAGAGFVHLRKGSDSGTATESTHSLQSIPPGLPVQETLPVTLSVLMVDDDSVLRKLLVRAVRGICPGWAIQEAASGEAALRLIDQDQTFDLIFMDQYMASMQKQLLGTEATRALRSKGVKAKICGLSANEMARDFFAAGADAFVCKPMPTKKETMKQVLLDILGEDQQSERAPYRRQRSSLVITPANVR